MIKSFAVTNNLNERLDMVLTEPEESGIVVKSVTGLGPGKANVSIKEIANGDGGSFNGARIPVRNIVMDLVFIANPTIEDTRQLTYKFFPLKKQITLTVVTDNLEVNIDGYVESNEPDIFSNMEGCQISILCEKPYFYTARDQLTTSTGSVPMFEFPVDNELIENGDIIINNYWDVDIFSGRIYNDELKKSPYTGPDVWGEHVGNEYIVSHYNQYVPIDRADISLPFFPSQHIVRTGRIPNPVVIDKELQGSNGGWIWYTNTMSYFYMDWPWKRDKFKEKNKYTLSISIDVTAIDRPDYRPSHSELIYPIRFLFYVTVEDKIPEYYEELLNGTTLTQNDNVLASIYYDPEASENPNEWVIYTSSKNNKVNVEINDDVLNYIYENENLPLNCLICGIFCYNPIPEPNSEVITDSSKKNNVDKVVYNCSALVHDVVLMERIMPEEDVYVDKTMPDYTFTQNGVNYNLQASEGIIMGDIQKYGFNHTVIYDGNASIGFQMTIGFIHNLVTFDENGYVEDPGYIVITSNYYPRKKMVIDLKKVYEILQSVSNEKSQIIPITQPGDQIFIDTRKKKKTIKYQKHYDYTISDPDGNSILWDHAGYKINILAASNRDIAWFELNQGRNEFTIRHASDPDMESEENLENNHSEYLEVEIRNKIYYLGV